jgi:hypothetical protein
MAETGAGMAIEEALRELSEKGWVEGSAAFLGAWELIGERARSVITSLVPKVRLETITARSDATGLEFFAESPPPTTILIGEKTLVARRATARQLAPALQAKSLIVPGQRT